MKCEVTKSVFLLSGQQRDHNINCRVLELRVTKLPVLLCLIYINSIVCVIQVKFQTDSIIEQLRRTKIRFVHCYLPQHTGTPYSSCTLHSYCALPYSPAYRYTVHCTVHEHCYIQQHTDKVYSSCTPLYPPVYRYTVPVMYTVIFPSIYVHCTVHVKCHLKSNQVHCIVHVQCTLLYSPAHRYTLQFI